MTAPDSSVTTYGYDALNRLNGLANSWAGSFGFGYDALSRRTSLTWPDAPSFRAPFAKAWAFHNCDPLKILTYSDP
ncbi:MAG TPA: hypothetical protein VMP68_19765 [Candidatus Eisenbacteria bacterium]|nr:hypothetical protein [Candidatus Eisenbacteria bacterium]